MKLIDFRNKLAGSLFAFALLFGTGLAANVTAQSQYPQAQYPQSQNDRSRRDRDYRGERRRDRDSDWRNNNWRRGRYNDGYPDLGGSFNFRQTALNAGYNEGIKAGRDDQRRGRAYEYRDESNWQKATKDFSSKLGDRGIYQIYFRQAFANAYADGYSGY